MTDLRSLQLLARDLLSLPRELSRGKLTTCQLTVLGGRVERELVRRGVRQKSIFFYNLILE